MILINALVHQFACQCAHIKKKFVLHHSHFSESSRVSIPTRRPVLAAIGNITCNSSKIDKTRLQHNNCMITFKQDSPSHKAVSFNFAKQAAGILKFFLVYQCHFVYTQKPCPILQVVCLQHVPNCESIVF